MEARAGQQTVFVVDDDRGLVRLIERALQREGFVTSSANSGRSALDWLAQKHADLMLLDLKLQDIEGQELVNRLPTANRFPPFIIITAQVDERIAVDTRKRETPEY